MGTTLALNGAYHLAGALARQPDDIAAAFAQYETSMRPIVEQAQKLPPGMPYLVHLETGWGVQILRTIASIVTRTGIIKLMFKLKGPPPETVVVEDYGFEQQEELAV